MNLAINFLLAIQPFLMGYSIYLFFARWKNLPSLRWLTLIPIAGLCQFLFSIIIAPILISNQKNTILKDNSIYYFQTLNLLFISVYGIVEYYSICKFIEINLKSSKAKRIITGCSYVTLVFGMFFLIIHPLNEVYSNKLLTIILSFQLIIFSIFLLGELIFNEKDEDISKNPIFLATSGIFILVNSACPIYYLSGFFATNLIPASHILNLIILLAYMFFYSTIIYTLRWRKI